MKTIYLCQLILSVVGLISLYCVFAQFGSIACVAVFITSSATQYFQQRAAVRAIMEIPS